MNLNLQGGAVENFSIALKDAAGNAVLVPVGTLSVASTNSAVASATLSADGSTLSVLGSAEGSATVTVTDGKLSASIDVSVVAGPAVEIVLTDIGAGSAPVAEPAAAPAATEAAAPAAEPAAAEAATAEAAPAADAAPSSSEPAAS